MQNQPCPICRENHSPDRGLSFDGMGINDCSIYRERIATIRPDARHLGQVFAAAPEMLEALEGLAFSYRELLADYCHEKNMPWDNLPKHLKTYHETATRAIAKAKGEV